MGFLDSVNYGIEVSRTKILRLILNTKKIAQKRGKEILTQPLTQQGGWLRINLEDEPAEEGEGQGEEKVEETPEEEEVQGPVTSFAPLDGSELSFFDDFHAVNGMPAFILQGNPGLIKGDKLSRSKGGMSVRSVWPEKPTSAQDPTLTIPQVEEYDESQHYNTAVRFSSDGSRLVTGHNNGLVKVWDAHHGTLIKQKDIHNGAKVADVSFRLTSIRDVVSCDWSGRLCVWDVVRDKVETVDCSGAWFRQSGLIQPVVVWPRFASMGNTLVFPVKRFPAPLTAGDVEAMDVTTNRERVFEFSFYLFETTNPDNGQSQVPSVSAILPEAMNLACFKLAPNGNGIFAGFVSAKSESIPGSGFVWPDVERKPHMYATVPGAFGEYSDCCEMLVTWMPPMDVPLRESKFFVWDVADLEDSILGSEKYCVMPEKKNLRKESVYGPTTISDPSGYMILGCHFLPATNGVRCLACCSGAPGCEIQIVVWNTETWSPVYTLKTGGRGELFSGPDGRSSAWERKWGSEVAVKGLESFGVTLDKSWMGFVCGQGTSAIVWDAVHGVEVLRLDFPRDILAQLDGNADLVMGMREGNFAIVGDKTIVLVTPRPPYTSDLLGAQTTVMKCADRRVDLSQKCIVKFSGNSQRLAILHPFSTVLYVMDLDSGQTFTVEREEHPPYKFCDFAVSYKGDLIVTVTQDRELLMWQVHDGQEPELLDMHLSLPGGFCHVGRPTQAVTFVYDDQAMQTIVVCELDGTLRWYQFRRQQTESVELDDDEPQEGTSMWLRVAGVFSTQGRDKSKPRIKRLTTSLFSMEVERRERAAPYACRFSADGRTAIAMPNPSQVVVWDLVTKASKVINYKVQFGMSMYAPSIDRVSMTGEFAVVGRSKRESALVLCYPNTTLEELIDQVGSIPSALSIAPNDRFILTDDFQNVENLGTPRTGAMLDVSSVNNELYIIDRQNHNREKAVRGQELDPVGTVTISPDGRRIACMTLSLKLRVWTAYSAVGLVPDYDAMVMDVKERNKAHIQEVLKDFGRTLLNYPDPTGMSLLMRGLDDLNLYMLKLMLKWAIIHGVKVRLRNIGGGGLRGIIKVDEVSNALAFAMQRRSPDSALQIARAILKRVTHNTDMAQIFQESIVSLGKLYPAIMLEILSNDRIFIDICQVEVPEAVFEFKKFLTRTDDSLEPLASTTEKNWTEGIHEGETIKVSAKARVIPFPHGAQVGEHGLLRPLILNDTPTATYSCLPIRMIISQKWRMYGEELMMSEVLHYGILLFFFSTYSVLIGDSSFVTDQRVFTTRHGITATVCLFISWWLAVMNLLREMKQMRIYWIDSGGRGFLFWLASGWNWIEVGSYVLLVFVIPFKHATDAGIKDDDLSTVVAAASIMLWWKLLYYARAFKKTGPLVLIISSIIQDMILFLFLAFMLLLGFGLAFFVQYRGLRWKAACQEDDECRGSQLDAYESDKRRLSREDREAIEESFSSLARTLMTMFGFMLGDFDMAVLYLPSNNGVSVILFILYEFAIAILLLNLLIAIMGDSFDRIKNMEETEFLRARALAIDDLESMMSEAKIEQLRAEIGEYQHVLVPVYRFFDVSETEWKGRAVDLQKKFKREIQFGLKQPMFLMKKMMLEMKKLREEVRSMRASQGLSRQASPDLSLSHQLSLAGIAEGGEEDSSEVSDILSSSDDWSDEERRGQAPE